MRTDTLLKRIRTAREHLEKGEFLKVYKLLTDTEERLKEEIEKKKNKQKEPQVRELLIWYERLWNGTPPEALKFTEYRKVIGKHLKDLIRIYRNNNLDVEDLKAEYEAFKEADPKLVGWKKRLLGDRGIVQFRFVLSRWKGDSFVEKSSWTTPENERGLDYYLGGDAPIEF